MRNHVKQNVEEPQKANIGLIVNGSPLFVPFPTEEIAKLLRIDPKQLQSFAVTAAYSGKLQVVASFAQRDIAETILDLIQKFQIQKGPFIAQAYHRFQLLE